MKQEHKHCLKRVAAAALVMLMVSGTVPFQPIAEVFDTAITASAAEITSRGEFDNGVSWTLDSDGKLTVTGTGNIPEDAFWDNRSEIKSVVIENGITSIENRAFIQCANLTSVTIPNTVTSIGDSVFGSCSSLTSVVIPNSVTSIGTRAFLSCTSLTSIIIPSSVKKIDYAAFKNDVTITDVYLYAAPENLTWDSWWYYGYDFITNPSKGTKCHVYMKDLQACKDKFNAINATFVGDLGFDKIDAKDATCTTAGNIEYYKDSQDGKYYNKTSDTTYEEITKDQTVVAAAGHDWGEVSYTWSNDNLTVTATRTCENDASHVETETVNTTSEVTKAATCVDKGETTYTATFTKEAFAEQTKTVEDVDAIGHTYGEPTWTWNGTESATATFVCEKGDDTQTVNATITSNVTTAPTYTEVGKADYTATADFNGTTYTDTNKNGDVPMLECTRVVINTIDINGTKTSKTVKAEIFKSSDYTVPANTFYNGFDFFGWKVNGTLYNTAELAQSAVETLVAQKPETAITVEVVYEKIDEHYTVTVTSGTLENGESGNTYQASTLIKAVANPPENGKKFSHWPRNGEKISTNELYSFFMPSENITLEAVYVDDTGEFHEQGTAIIESVTRITSTNKVAFVSVVNVPVECKLVKGGLVATSDSTVGENVTAENAQYVKLSTKAGANTKNLKYTWTKSGVTESTTWYVRSYLVYKDANGTQHTVYSKAVKANINGIINE